MTQHISIFPFYYLFFLICFLLVYNKINKKISAFDIAESRSKEMWLVSYLTCVDIIAQAS